ncbi:MAG: hypothetical protein K5650_02030 [Bacteroidales bacterium]|nr:hypothetical protein [Bacteroidales bacterium]
MNNISAVNRDSALRDGAMVALLTGTACLIPALSHLIALPLSALNPMLLLLVTGVALIRDRRFGYALAIAMPLLACLITGMPTPLKAVCMVAEFSTVVLLLTLLGSRWSAAPTAVVSIIGGKVVYYAIKAAILSPAVLVGTPWGWQAISIFLSCAVFCILSNKMKK